MLHPGGGKRRAEESSLPNHGFIFEFYEGVSTGRLLEKSLMHRGLVLHGLASLDTRGNPRRYKGIAKRVAAAGMLPAGRPSGRGSR